MHKPLTHRGAEILIHEVPGAGVTWTHDETNTHGVAVDVAAARIQINHHLESPDPDCPACSGHGTDDWAYLAISPCKLCWG